MNEVMKTQSEREIAAQKTIQPACSICEADEEVLLQVEMPGVSKDDIEVKIEKNELTISGTAPVREEHGAWLLRERRSGSYQKRFVIDDSVDREKIDAVMKDGVLSVTLRKREAAKPRKIQIA